MKQANVRQGKQLRVGSTKTSGDDMIKLEDSQSDAGSDRPDGIQSPFRLRSMNTEVEACYLGEPEQVRQANLLTLQWFQSVEHRFSRFIPESELNAINESGGRPCLVSETMMEVLAMAQAFRERTGGVFNPLLLHALQSCGYAQSFEYLASGRHCDGNFENGRNGWQTGLPDIAGPLGLDRTMNAVTLPPGAGLDLGGIVKGWAVRRFAAWLKSSRSIGAGWLNAGGDLTVWGMESEGGAPLAIGVEHPWKPDEDAAVLLLGHGCAATSSKLGRRWETGRGSMHHLIDPATQLPSDSDIVQCTVTGPDLAECEVWAKTVCIAGVERGLELFARKAAGYEAVYFTTGGRTGYAGSAESIGRRWLGLSVNETIETVPPGPAAVRRHRRSGI